MNRSESSKMNQVDAIVIKGAHQHNLKNIDLEIPRNRMVVITGISGSGKSSLAFDTIYAEGQRRYIESLSTYARQFLGQMDKPAVESIEGLSPAIAIEQRKAGRNPRSTVATLTEIHDYFRLLFARIGKPHCWVCNRPIEPQTSSQIIEEVMNRKGSKVKIMAPVARGKKGEYRDLFANFKKKGFFLMRVDGEIFDLSEDDVTLDKNRRHDIEVIVDRVTIKPDAKNRVADSVQSALSMGSGVLLIEHDGEEELFSEHLSCPHCNVSMEKPEPRTFSFNSPYGACKECHGLGTIMEVDPDLAIRDRDRSIADGAIPFWGQSDESWTQQRLRAVADHLGFSIETPLKDLSKEQLNVLLYGSEEPIRVRIESSMGELEYEKPFEGLIPGIRRRYSQTNSDGMREWYGRFMSERACPSCKGDRLKPESLAVTVNGKNIAEVTRLTVEGALNFFNGLELTKRDREIVGEVLREITGRLKFLMDTGLDYIALDRKSSTLSAGESQRINLATQIGSKLTGVTYVLDEPTIGLHPRDNARLIRTLLELRDVGNSILVVEHDAEVILSADWVVDLGPGAGAHGGEIVASGTPEQILESTLSLTGSYLRGDKKIEMPEKRRRYDKHLTIRGAREHNLKNIDVHIPLETLTCITGVSGSGKSTLLEDVLYKVLARKLYRSPERPGAHDAVEGMENIDKVMIIDQSPIGRTPRSNPATYTNAFTPIRELYSKLPESRVRGYLPGRFSFNVKGGRCEACQGHGIVRLQMNFLPDVYVPCKVCKGKRFNAETLQITYKGKNISDVLEMTVDEGMKFFGSILPVYRKLKTLSDVGLGYIKLGQPAPTLSGGEAQRVKLAAELAKKATGKTLYLLDEPTTGLHFDDIKKLLCVLDRLVDAGNTAVIIEHNLDVIKTADYIIDLGPEGGENGGYIVAEGTPEEVSGMDTHTGKFLRNVLVDRPYNPISDKEIRDRAFADRASINV